MNFYLRFKLGKIWFSVHLMKCDERCKIREERATQITE